METIEKVNVEDVFAFATEIPQGAFRPFVLPGSGVLCMEGKVADLPNRYATIEGGNFMVNDGTWRMEFTMSGLLHMERVRKHWLAGAEKGENGFVVSNN